MTSADVCNGTMRYSIRKGILQGGLGCKGLEDNDRVSRNYIAAQECFLA